MFYKLLLSFFTIAFSFTILAGSVYALDVTKGVGIVTFNGYGGDAHSELLAGPEKGLYSRIGSVINVFLGAIGTVIFIIVIYAGWLWLTAGGNDDQVAKSRKWLTNAVIGAAIVTAAFFISDYILEIATGIKN